MPARVQAPRATRTAYTCIALTVTALAVALRALFIVLANRVPLQFVYGAGFTLEVLGLIASVLVLALLLRRTWRGLRRGESVLQLSSLRLGCVALVVAWVLFLWCAQPYQRIHFDAALGLAAGLWGSLVYALTRLSLKQPRVARIFDFIAFSLCAATLGAELGLRAYASLWPSALFARVSASPLEMVQRFRCEPGQVRFGFACNSRGYYDTEFYRKSEADEGELVVSIGDSFSVGAVPHAWHYTTIFEELTGDNVYNMGVAGIGPPEYAHLVSTEAVPLQPDEIWISLFVGNDLSVADLESDLPDQALRAWLQRENVLLAVVPARIARVRLEKQRLSSRVPESMLAHGANERRASDTRAAITRTEAARNFPWVTGPSLEEPALSEETFLHMETKRAIEICGQVPVSLDVVHRSLLAARRAAGSIPLRVLLIPDEFQVEDALWATVQARAGRPLDRDQPQQLLRSWLERENFDYLDLLPALRAVPPMADGRRHLYHAADTHFNARGNEVAAEALVSFKKRVR